MHRSPFLLIVPLAAVLGGCGAGAPSVAEFAADADAGCGPAGAELARVAKPGDHAQLATGAGILLQTVRGQVDQLRTQKSPGGAAKVQVEELVGSMESLTSSTRALQQGAGAKDDAAVARASTDTSARYQDASTKATALGLTACVTGMKPAVDQLTTGTRELLKVSYQAKGDAICDIAGTKIEALPEPPARPKNLTPVVQYFDKIIPILGTMVGDLKALPAPPGDEAVVAETMGAQDSALAKMREFRDASAANDFRRILALEKDVGASFELADAKFISYGFKNCGSES